MGVLFLGFCFLFGILVFVSQISRGWFDLLWPSRESLSELGAELLAASLAFGAAEGLCPSWVVGYRDEEGVGVGGTEWVEEVHWWAAYLWSLVQLESLPEFTCFSGLLALALVLQTAEPCAYSSNWSRPLLGSEVCLSWGQRPSSAVGSEVGERQWNRSLGSKSREWGLAAGRLVTHLFFWPQVLGLQEYATWLYSFLWEKVEECFLALSWVKIP